MAYPKISIQIENLSKQMGTHQALQGVSLSLESGLLHGLIGPEGSGKTTLLRHLIGLLKPTEGRVVYRDHGKPKAFEKIRPLMAYMPQLQSLYADLSVSEHLDFFRDLYQIPEKTYQARRKELLHITRLEPFQDRPAGQLSGGMYKKLGLMCALLQSPNLVLLDEPTTGVDPISRREFWELLYRLREEGILIVITTAYMDEAERCDRVHVLERGKLLATGEPKEILEKEKVESFEKLFLKYDTVAAKK
ncbi:MAG TPA: ABC transporter ATP-binding protein [bacterium]|jgi:ABC-2 type transport system ATP-binding protein|nr:ABC transporter ATP-binding protein [bacterium]